MPSGLNVFNKSSTSLEATWSPPPINKIHGHIRHYLIKYWEVQCSKYWYGTVNGTVNEKTVGANNHSVILDKLKYWKCYQVNVTAFTVGEGPYATDNESRTSENGIYFILHTLMKSSSFIVFAPSKEMLKCLKDS